MMTAATLFSGIGAPEMAMPDWRWPWHAEIEKFPAAVMAARHPHSINLGDVSADDFADRAAAVARPDVLIFGSPCQDFSVAGRRLGMAGARGNMALIALGIVGRIKPSWFVFENVPGLLSNWSGAEEGPAAAGSEWESVENSDFAAFLGAVDELRYSGAWASLDAQYRGVAQRRERLFFVGHSGDWRASAAVLFEPEVLCGHPPARRQSGEGNSGRVAHSLRGEGFDASEDGTGRGTPIAIAYALGSHAGAADGDQTNRSHAAGGPVGSGISAELSHSLRGVRTQSIAAVAVDYTNASLGDISGTLEAAQSKGNRGQGVICAIQEAQTGVREYDTAGSLRANGPGHDPVGTRVREGSAVRRLTPRECERLQGFPDDYTAVTFRGKPAADGPRYKALGNSMAVPVMRWILSRIEAVSEVSHAA